MSQRTRPPRPPKPGHLDARLSPGRVVAYAVTAQTVEVRLSRINPGESKPASPGQRCDPRGPREPRCYCYWPRSAPQVGPWRKRKVRACLAGPRPLRRALAELWPSVPDSAIQLPAPPLLSPSGTVGGTGRFVSGMGETGAAEGRETGLGTRGAASIAWEPPLCAPGLSTAPNLVASLFCAQ